MTLAAAGLVDKAGRCILLMVIGHEVKRVHTFMLVNRKCVVGTCICKNYHVCPALGDCRAHYQWLVHLGKAL